MGGHLRDVAALCVVLCGPVPLCLAMVRLARREHDAGIPAAHAWLVFLTGWCVFQTSVGLVLGLSGRLVAAPVLLAEGLLFAAGSAAFHVLGRGRGESRLRDVLVLPRPEGRAEAVVLAALVLVASALLFHAMLQPITEYDSLAYHLPTVAEWFQAGALTRPPLLHEGPIWGYPCDWEVLCCLFVLPLREDLLVAVPNVIAWGLLGVAVYALSRRLRVSRFHGMLGATLVMTVPLVLEQVDTLHVDLALAAFFMAGLYFAAWYAKTHSVVHLCLFLATLGMLSGVKTSGLAYGGLLVVTWVVLEVRRRRLKEPPPERRLGRKHRWLLPVLVLTAVGVMLLCTSWYFRNYLETRNPFGTLEIRIAGKTIFPGRAVVDLAFLRKTTLARVFRPGSFSDWRVLALVAGYFLQVPFLIMVLLTVLLLIRFPRRAGREVRPGHLAALGVLLVVTGALYAYTPYGGDNGTHGWRLTLWTGLGLRYALPFVAVLGVTGAVAASGLGLSRRLGAAAVLVCSALGVARLGWVWLAVFAGVGFVLEAVLAHTGFAARLRRMRPSRRGLRVVLCVAFAGLLVAGVWAARELRDANRLRTYGEITAQIERHTTPGETIGYVLSHRSWLFYGRRLDRRVVYVRPEGDDRARWLEQLRRQNIRIVAVGPLLPVWLSERVLSWLEEENGPFEPVFTPEAAKSASLYRLRSEAEAAPAP